MRKIIVLLVAFCLLLAGCTTVKTTRQGYTSLFLSQSRNCFGVIQESVPGAREQRYRNES